MPFRENPTITATEDVSAALSAVRESVFILVNRNREFLNAMDIDELERILDACDRIQEYHLIVRAEETQRFVKDSGR